MNDALQSMLDNMPAKTGRSYPEWKALLAQHQFAKHSEAMAFLKKEHGVTHGYANTILQLIKKESQPAELDLVAAQYVGKENLRPIYERLLEVVQGFGDDVEIAPKKTSVSLRRKVQFALVKPATKTRVDLGLKIKGQAPEGRLEDSGPFGTMCTHRIRLASAAEIDAEVINWLKTAYAGAGG